MKLNLTVLAEELAPRFEAAELILQNDRSLFSQVMLWPEDGLTEGGGLYVCPAAALPKVPTITDACAIVCLGEPPEGYRACNCIVLPEGTALSAVVNAIQHIFRKFCAWSDRLYQALYMEKGVQAILNETLRMFENPVYVHDKNYRIIAYAENHSLPGMDGRYGFLNYGRLSAKSIRALSRLPGFAETFSSTEPAYWQKTDSKVDKFSYLYSNLWLDGEYCGRIFVDERVRPIRRADYAVLGELTRVIQLAIKRRNIFSGSHLSQFGARMTQLLDGETLSNEVLEQELSDLGWSQEDPFFCFQIQLTDADVLFNTSLSLCDLVESKLHDCQAFTYRDHILMVVDAARWESRRKAFLMDFQPILTDFRLHAGVSLMFQGIGDLRRYYEQTCAALTFGLAQRPDENLHYFEQHTLDYLLSHSVEHFPAEMLCPRPLLKLMEYDSKNSTAFTETLRAYLECDSSPAQAMGRLFIHRSTFLYRLERIQALTGMDLTDQRLKLHLLLSFQLLDGSEHRERRSK